MHRVPPFAWVRKHGLASGWRAGHKRNDGIPSREIDAKGVHQLLVRISPPCSDAFNGAAEVTLEQIRGLYRTLRTQHGSHSGQPISNESPCCLVDPSRRLATRVLLLDQASAHLLNDCSLAVTETPLWNLENKCKRATQTLNREHLPNGIYLQQDFGCDLVTNQKRWNNLIDVPCPCSTLDAEESRNEIVRCPAPVEGPATEPAVPSPAAPPEPSLPVPRVCFREKRSAEDADMQERDEQTKAICDVCEESMGDVFDRDCEYPETDPISPAEGAAGRDAEIKKMLTFHESPPQDAPHRDLPVITLVPRGPDGKVKCRIAMHGFKRWVLTDSRYAATPLRVTLRLRLGEAAERSWDVEFFDVTKA